jgi:hypothetical protein
MKNAISEKANPRWRHALIAAALAGASAAASAAPYAITYQGTMGAAIAPVTTLPGITVGQSYTVTFVFDNGGATANAQTWTTADLTCAIWQMNNAKNAVFVQDLTATPPIANGSVTTNAGGALTAVFNQVEGSPAGSYTTSGITLVPAVNWAAAGGNHVFYDIGTGTTRAFTDTSGGVQMDIAHWSAPKPFTGSCNAASFAPVNTNTAAAVPTLGEWSLALLALTAAGFGARRLRRRG